MTTRCCRLPGMGHRHEWYEVTIARRKKSPQPEGGDWGLNASPGGERRAEDMSLEQRPQRARASARKPRGACLPAHSVEDVAREEKREQRCANYRLYRLQYRSLIYCDIRCFPDSSEGFPDRVQLALKGSERCCRVDEQDNVDLVASADRIQTGTDCDGTAKIMFQARRSAGRPVVGAGSDVAVYRENGVLGSDRYMFGVGIASLGGARTASLRAMAIAGYQHTGNGARHIPKCRNSGTDL